MSEALAHAYESFTQFCLGHHLASLPLHAPQILVAFLTYETIFLILSPAVSHTLYPSLYNQLPKKTKINWNVRVVSFIQATFICSQAISVIVGDESRRSSTASYETRLWTYSSASGNVQAFAAGYFLWDVLVSVQYLKILGPTSLMHAVAALSVTTLGFVSRHCIPIVFRSSLV